MAQRLSGVLECAPLEADAMRQALIAALGPGSETAAARLTERILARWPYRYPPPKQALLEIVSTERAFLALAKKTWSRGQAPPAPAIEPTPTMAPTPAFAGLGAPDWPTSRAMADGLCLEIEELEWLADLDGRVARAPEPARRHYHIAWIPKPSGGRRLIEAPKRRLRALQHEILRLILDRVPPHPAATAYAPGRSAIAGAAKHAGEAAVLTMDLRRFFPSIPARRVHALFRCLGYPPAAARLLTGLTTTRTHLTDAPAEERMRLRTPHLPQGAPTSPALANLCAGRLDRRLSGLARRLEATYTRYADDIALSGDAVVAQPWVRTRIAEIIAEEGFAVAPEKTRVMRASQRQTVTGIVVNKGVNLPRTEYDRLKATLTNCARHGPAGQNRDAHPAFRAHLEGRVAWAEQLNPRRGAKLRALFDRIAW